MRRPAASLLALLLIAAAPSRPEDASRQAREADAARSAALAARAAAQARATQAAAAAAMLTDARAKAGERLRAAEAETLQLADRMADLTRQQDEAQTRLAARAAAIAPLLPLIERLSLYPAETLLAVPETPEDAVRGLLILRGISRRLETEAVALRHEQIALQAARAAIAGEAPRLAEAEAAQLAAGRVLDRQIAAADFGRHAAETESAADARRAAEMAARADSLRALMARLDAAQEDKARQDKAAADNERRLREARQPSKRLAQPLTAASPVAASSGPLLVPVIGTIVRSWGQPTDAGPASGISYRAAPKARVVAPCNGRVAFAAPFRSYGQLLILNCGGGTDAVLAGLEKLAVHTGQSLRRGEPVGSMPGWEPTTPGDRPNLYVELRRRGEPVDPGPLMGTS